MPESASQNPTILPFPETGGKFGDEAVVYETEPLPMKPTTILAHAPAMLRRGRTIGGRNHADSLITPSVAAIGRVKNPSRLPSDLIMDEMKFSSSIPPSTTPSIAGALG